MCQDDFDINILTDEGKASASPKLMAAIENGNRELAQRSVHCFGAMAAKDPEAHVCVLAILHFVCTCDFNNIHLLALQIGRCRPVEEGRGLHQRLPNA